MTQQVDARSGSPPDLASLRARCATQERVLRMQYPQGLPPEVEQELAAAPGDTFASAVDRLVCIKVALKRWTAARTRATAAESEAGELAALHLLTREPVPVPLASGRTVEITGRSVAAIVEIASHEARLAMLQAEVEETRAALVALLARRRRERPGLRRRWRYRHHHRRLVERYEALHTAVARHLERMCAHVATADGAPARLEEAAPAWWREVAVEDTVALFLGCHEAGPGRAGRVPVEPDREPKGDGPRTLLFPRLLTGWGIRIGVRPAQLLVQDFGPTWVELQTAPRYTPEEEDT
ncbi:MAG: hypothetical protein AB1941_01895 [Gemmatimonadota bacterium]